MNILRVIFNNKLVLAVMIIALGFLFYFMLVQVENYEKALIKEATPVEVVLPIPLGLPSISPESLPPGMGGNDIGSSTSSTTP